jgi:hypothetical protein
MAIILLPEELDYLLKTLRSFHSTYWVTNKLIGKLEDQLKEKETRSHCTHIKASYTGHKDCCGKCGAFYEPGMGFDWSLDITNASPDLPAVSLDVPTEKAKPDRE